jgi:hypothetical protein
MECAQEPPTIVLVGAKRFQVIAALINVLHHSSYRTTEAKSAMDENETRLYSARQLEVVC